jgi:undecaprenyl-diphosphatase
MKTRSDSKILGLHLVAGSLVFAAMTTTLGFISEDVVNHEPLTVTDAQLSTWLHLHGSTKLTSAMLGITSLGATAVVICVTAVFVVYLFSRRSYYWIAATLSSVFGGMLLNRILKFAFQRPRPYFTDPILTLTSYSFPSGHTMIATALYGVVAAYFVAQSQDWRRRVLITFSASLVIVLVGFSRIYLGAHYLSDVLGAMAEGLAWLSLCLTAVYSLWRKRNHV